MVLVSRFEVAVVRHPQDGVGYILSDDLGDPLYDPLLGADFCKVEDVLSVGFVLGVAVVIDLRIDGDVVGAYKIGGRY